MLTSGEQRKYFDSLLEKLEKVINALETIAENMTNAK